MTYIKKPLTSFFLNFAFRLFIMAYIAAVNKTKKQKYFIRSFLIQWLLL